MVLMKNQSTACLNYNTIHRFGGSLGKVASYIEGGAVPRLSTSVALLRGRLPLRY